MDFSLSLALCLYPTLLASPLDFILCPYRAVIYRFLLVWSSNTCAAVQRGLYENMALEFVLTSPIMSYMYCLSSFDGFRDGRSVAVQLLFCGMSFSVDETLLLRLVNFPTRFGELPSSVEMSPF